ncbi:MAG: hypothetical protein IKE24_10870 [Clostridia bacterium]|nr:hypothetical protein [Clostridia bacterium]
MQPVINWRKFAWAAGILLGLFLAAFLILHGSLNSVRQEQDALTVTLTRLEETNKVMNEELNLVGTEDFIVNSARTNYAFMNKDDLRFQFTNPEALYAYTEEELKILMDEMAD